MPTTYAHDLFGKKIYKKLPQEVREIIRENKDLYRIGLHGPDILFYYLVVPNPVTELGARMHDHKAGYFFTEAMKQVRETESRALLAYLLGFGCHYLLDSACHPYVNQVAASHVLAHSALETEFDRYLMEQTGRDPHTYRPSVCIVPRVKYARKIHQVLPQVSTRRIFRSLKMMRFLTNLMVCSDRGRRRRLLEKILYLRKNPFTEDLIGHFMTEKPLAGSALPVRKLKKYYDEEVLAAPEELMELYQLFKNEEPLSKRWYRTYQG